jgi:hypothetical protein
MMGRGGTTAVLCCRWCDERVSRSGSADPDLAMAVHEGTGAEACAGGGHLAAPIERAPGPARGGRDMTAAPVYPGKVTAAMLADTFPDWRVFRAGRRWHAMRDGTWHNDGTPRSLLRHALSAPDLDGLAEQLCLQAWLDDMGEQKRAAVWRDTVLPALTGPPC